VLPTEAAAPVTLKTVAAVMVCASPAKAVPDLLPLKKLISAVVMALTEIVLPRVAAQATSSVIKKYQCAPVNI